MTDNTNPATAPAIATIAALDWEGVRCYWKIDYYDPSLEWGSSNPADPAQTARVLTILRADEY